MYKYWVKYEKSECARFISHLDLLRALDRAIRRAEIPIAYSQGFNPHPKMSFATPLSVGIISQGDYLELELAEEVDVNSLIERINRTLPLGIKILQGKKIEKKVPTLGSIVEATKYRVEIKESNLDVINEKINKLMNQQEIILSRKGKKRVKEVDIRPLILYLNLNQWGNLIMLLTTNNTSNAKPKEILSLLSIDNSNIDKLETYCNSSKNELITPLQWLDLD